MSERQKFRFSPSNSRTLLSDDIGTRLHHITCPTDSLVLHMVIISLKGSELTITFHKELDQDINVKLLPYSCNNVLRIIVRILSLCISLLCAALPYIFIDSLIFQTDSIYESARNVFGQTLFLAVDMD